MSYGNGVQAYKQVRVNTASQGELLIMLFDAAIRHMNRANERILVRDYASTNAHLLKAQAILNELMASLDFSVELARVLFRLYEYCHHELVNANVSKKNDGILAALEIMSGLRAAWHQAIREDAAQRSAVAVSQSRGRGGIEIAH